MDNFLNALRNIVGIGNRTSIVGDKTQDMANRARTMGKTIGIIAEDAGQSSPVLPKAPSFITPDPVWKTIKNSQMDDDVKERIWYGYQNDMRHLDDESAKEFRKRLGTGADFFNGYYNSLLERDMSGELDYAADNGRLWGYEMVDEYGNLWGDPVMRWNGGFDSYRKMQNRRSTGAGYKWRI